MMDFAGSVREARGGTFLFSLGQAGFLIKNRAGKLLAIDPYLSDCVEHLEGHMGFKRLLPKLLNPGELEFEAVIATHGHLDHFDKASMRSLLGDGNTKLYASTGCRQLAEEAGIDAGRTVYARPGDACRLDGFGIRFVNCDHGAAAPDAVGVVVEADGKWLYEAGDTCLRLDRIGEAMVPGGLDVLIAPINGAYGNMDEEDCARLSGALKPKVTVPCHYGMFASHGGSPGKFWDIMKEKYPRNRVLLMAQGEKFELGTYGRNEKDGKG